MKDRIDRPIGRNQKAILLNNLFCMKAEARRRRRVMPDSFTRIEDILLGQSWPMESELQVAYVRFGEDLDVKNYGTLLNDLDPLFKSAAVLLGWAEDDAPKQKRKSVKVKIDDESKDRPSD